MVGDGWWVVVVVVVVVAMIDDGDEIPLLQIFGGS